MTDEASTEYLATYGPLMPGGENHWLVRPIAGEWQAGSIRGWTYPIGFGPAEGEPGLTLAADGPMIEVAVLGSDRLDKYWRDIDDFQGLGYRRTRVPVQLDDGGQLAAWIYETDPEAE